MRFLYLLVISFVFITTTAFTINKTYKVPAVEKEQLLVFDNRYEKTALPSLPLLKEGVVYPVVSAQSVFMMDVDSAVPLYEKNPDGKFLPASTTKMVTALVSLDFYPMDAVLRINSIRSVGQRMRLVAGEEISVENLLYGLLVFSANDAADVLAANYYGGREAFVAAMNDKAKELNLENTVFVNPSGLDSAAQVTTARDLARIAAVAMENVKFREFVATKNKIVTSADGSIVHRLTNINSLLGEVEGVLGVKTGWTENARENLVTYVDRDGKKVVIVVLGSQDRFGETKELIEWVYSSYHWREVKPS